jgi:hypothetical protein
MMADEQFTDEYEAPEADAAEQSLPVDERGREPEADEDVPDEPRTPWEADPADAADQAVAVPVDEDEYR